MKQFERIYKDPIQFKALTTLEPAEFDQLVFVFEQVASWFFETMNSEGLPRKKRFTFTKHMIFQSYAEMLFFVLYYVKINPLQQEAAAFFGMKQSQVSEWVNRLTPILERTFELTDSLPAQNAQDLTQKVTENENLLIDVTERPINRPQDFDEQKKYYSGKKKSILLKTP